MKLQDFHVELASWANAAQRDALRALRQEVFVLGQNVPKAREQDGLDGDCQHVLARDETGVAIGCARMDAHGKIGRMAVREPWRGRGVGAAMLRELVALARSRGAGQVTLAAQLSALGFYVRGGFIAFGEEFEDAGMPHRMMRLDLHTARPEPPPLRDHGALAVGNRADVVAARLQLLADSRHQLLIRVPTLDLDIYAGPVEIEQLRRVAISGRAASIRILLHDPTAALVNDHPLVALAQRLASAFEIRMPVDPVDLAWIGAYTLNDVGGYLYLPDASRPSGRAARDDRGAQAPLRQQFNEVWERAEPASMLKALHL
ncbi:MAG: GNAT family N-acetyltransferase [Rhodanobacter sp.]